MCFNCDNAEYFCRILDPRLANATAHMLDGVYALAWGHKEQQRALGAAGACQAVAALMRAPRMQSDPVLLEKSLRAVRVLCRYGIRKDTRDEANEQALAAAGACEGRL